MHEDLHGPMGPSPHLASPQQFILAGLALTCLPARVPVRVQMWCVVFWRKLFDGSMKSALRAGKQWRPQVPDKVDKGWLQVGGRTYT